MPCSSPGHAPLQVRGQRLGPNVLPGAWFRLTNARVRKRTCSRINSYFDPSVGSDCGSLMSICLAGISLDPGNPTVFLRIGGGFEGGPISHKHTLDQRYHVRGGVRGGHGVVLAACCVQGSISGVSGSHLKDQASRAPHAETDNSEARRGGVCTFGSVYPPEGQTLQRRLTLQQKQRETCERRFVVVS